LGLKDGRPTVEQTAVFQFQVVRQSWRFRSLGLALLASATAACSDGRDAAPSTTTANATTAPQAAPAGTQEGEFVTYVADFEDGHSERWHALRTTDGREIRLALDNAPTMTSGARVRVRGDLVNEGLHVSDYELLSSPSGLESAPVTYPAPPSADTFALVLVDLGSGVDVDGGSGQTAMFSTNPADKSFASFYYESSYGKYSITGAVVGPYTFSMTTCDTTGMYKAIEAAQATALAPYKHLIYYFKKSSLCTFGGLGEEGSQSAPAKRTWMNGSLSCVVLMQEPGHNLGLMHANSMACGTSSFSTTPATSCTITEYGNTVTPMGSGCHQLNGYEKWYEQWLSGCNGVRVTSSAAFNLVPLGISCPGALQVLQIPMPATLAVSDPQATTTTVNLKDYYVELRAAAGTFDQYGGGRGGGAGGGVTYTAPTVFVYVSDDVHPGTSTGRGGGGSASVWTELLNMNPGTTPFTGLTAAGQSFKDPAGGPTITLQSISAAGAIVAVTVPNGAGGPTCIDGTTLSGSGSACDGGAVTIPPFDAGMLTDAGASDAGPGAPDGAASNAEAGAAGDAGAVVADAGSPGRDGASSSATDAGAGQPGAGGGSSASDATANDALWNREGAKPAGCSCDTVGAGSPRWPGGGLLGVGALALLGWRLTRRTPRTEPRRRPCEYREKRESAELRASTDA
jgi:hypothetical protein